MPTDRPGPNDSQPKAVNSPIMLRPMNPRITDQEWANRQMEAGVGSAQGPKKEESVPQVDVVYKTRGQSTFDEDKYSVNSYHYPEDLLSASNQYGNTYVIFYINVQSDSKLTSKNWDGTSDVIPDGVDASTSGQKSNIKNNNLSIQQTIAATSAAAAIQKIGSGSVTAIATAGLTTTAATEIKGKVIMSQTSTANRATKRLKNAVALYMPNELVVSYKTEWSGADTAAMAMGSLGVEAIKNAIASMIPGKSTSENSQIAGLGGAAANVALTEGGAAADYLSAAAGIAANPKKEMLFKSVDFRSFQFTYKFVPRNPSELQLVENIIKIFKLHMHPEYKEKSANYLFVYPSEFDILYYVNGQENMHLHRHTSCVLTGMSVNYTPNSSFTAFGGSTSATESNTFGTAGAPTEISVNMTFQELAILTKAEIGDGY